jgi:predicted phosphohydrolase
MAATLQLAFTADLHWGHGGRGDEATRQLASFLCERPPDILILAGDIGTGSYFDDCLHLFADLPGRKALVPGNHDLWVRPDAPRDSLQVYQEDLAESCRRNGFHYLDQGPLVLPEVGLALVGSINWYDYTWSQEEIRQAYPGEEGRLTTKLFTRGRHNDTVFVRWPLDDARFTARAVAMLEQHLLQALEQIERVIIVAHHPPLRCISFPEKAPPLTLDDLLWEAFGGNRAMEDLLTRHAERIAFAFCGHTHREREGTWHGIRAYNIGGDYHYKRLLWLDWPAGTITAHQFGDAAR